MKKWKKATWLLWLHAKGGHENWKHVGVGPGWSDAGKDEGLFYIFHHVSSAWVTTVITKSYAFFYQMMTPLLVEIWKIAWWVLKEIASWVALLIFGPEYSFDYPFSLSRTKENRSQWQSPEVWANPGALRVRLASHMPLSQTYHSSRPGRRTSWGNLQETSTSSIDSPHLRKISAIVTSFLTEFLEQVE